MVWLVLDKTNKCNKGLLLLFFKIKQNLNNSRKVKGNYFNKYIWL